MGLLDGTGNQASDLFKQWEVWFADVEESHTSQGSLPFFRSPQLHRHWLTASGAVMDAAALQLSTVESAPVPYAALCLRAGYLSLRHIADFFGVDHNTDPLPTDPISITREEFDEACAEMSAVGVPLRADRDQPWRDFSGWRVNYDTVLVTLAGFFMAPYAPWSSDRSIRFRVRSRSITARPLCYAGSFSSYARLVRRSRPTRSNDLALPRRRSGLVAIRAPNPLKVD